MKNTLIEPVDSAPAVVSRLAVGGKLRLVWTNERGGMTFSAGNHFIKWNPYSTGLDLEAERLRLAWAIRWHPVPKVLAWGADDEAQWLVTSALPGEGAVTEAWIAQPRDAARAIGRGLRTLHDALPIAECPFDWSIEARTQGRVSAESLGAPPVDRLVVCHGDACSPNTIIAPDGSFAGHVDLGSLGVADRWADLAVASMNLDYDFEGSWEDELFSAYGIARDEERIEFYRHLWENEDKIGIPQGSEQSPNKAMHATREDARA
ncbi:aminoglycoside 3'-phosphotransferase [Solimonas sp. K1W22B-7]|uniref:aminoglycoside 3'-phosphotransferase n=1 Tax=Solimonas sp. K1W22B-7 TaxID=2303331 RepID=UPI000E32E2C4|nr:aminoglycoside 3'-phosphotransferase [Solimonas sp. K1W22B-7]AXQ27976.1 aminoglycoside 3'-phosphotransferase [Solimonas sp. K1W22B-7]